MENKDVTIEQKESIKLVKNSRGYNWEIKVLHNDLDKLIELNNKMVAQYGTQDD